MFVTFIDFSHKSTFVIFVNLTTIEIVLLLSWIPASKEFIELDEPLTHFGLNDLGKDNMFMVMPISCTHPMFENINFWSISTQKMIDWEKKYFL